MCAVGGVIAANIDGSNLGEAPLDEFWSAAVDLAVPIFIHPTQPTPLPRTRHYGLNQIVQYTYDTTASVGSLIFSGVLDRFPDLTLILSHGGGYFPYQAGRFDRVYRDLKGPTAPLQPPSAYLRHFFYDTILHHPVSAPLFARPGGQRPLVARHRLSLPHGRSRVPEVAGASRLHRRRNHPNRRHYRRTLVQALSQVTLRSQPMRLTFQLYRGATGELTAGDRIDLQHSRRDFSIGCSVVLQCRVYAGTGDDLPALSA